eukprot:CAMPEP_0114538660 /NCGR_PEP_ID=MMETSP0109-20121206/30263_1 /TAXON_ID=29199 /ORGANISM="Chlorarachnion reptans, Strain CCCM449" /LENGTH=300 /DNA_ID=CAMNT_0001722697 /DNA_START=288 /DNA_END=1191 /DNA_ORIENTATION=-
MIRIKDPKVSVAHYQEVYGMRLIDELRFPDMKFTLYFLASMRTNQETPEPGTPEAHVFLWNFPGTVLELTHNWGTESDEKAVYHPGNQKGDGFGLSRPTAGQSEGVFKKKPDEGRMKGLAFAYDPDKYWVEIIRRNVPLAETTYGYYTFKQTMLRVKDPKRSLMFYTKYMGMTVVKEKHFNDFSLYFLATVEPGETEEMLGNPILELTHNHGTELDPDFKHFTGNEEGRKGFGHLGFLVDDVYEKCKELEESGYRMKKKPDAGTMKGLAFALDPDGYWIEIIKRGGYDTIGTPYFLEDSK